MAQKKETTKKTTAGSTKKKTAEAKPMDPVFLTPFDRYLLAKSTNYKVYQKMGAHPGKLNGKKGMHFAVCLDARHNAVLYYRQNHESGDNCAFLRR